MEPRIRDAQTASGFPLSERMYIASSFESAAEGGCRGVPRQP